MMGPYDDLEKESSEKSGLGVAIGFLLLMAGIITLAIGAMCL